MSPDRSWIRMSKSSNEWQKRFKEFIQFTFGGSSVGETAPCPCTRCRSMSYKTRSEVESHLVNRGFDESFIQGDHGEDPSDANVVEGVDDEDATHDGSSVRELISSLIKGAIHGDIIINNEGGHTSNAGASNDVGVGPSSAGAGKNQEPNNCAQAFFKLLKEAEKELYPGCKEATKISFIVRFFQIKCMFGFSNKALEAILHLFSLVLPKGHCVPNTLEKVQKVVRDLGLDYQKIHACINDCVLFLKDYSDLDNCPVCGECRWKRSAASDIDEGSSSGTTKKRVPRKILRYFPLTPRLQRLYMRDTTSSHMRWHKESRVTDGTMRHPADSLAWKHLDDMYPLFSSDARNVRLGLASDGFNPFGIMNVSYTTWPVILIPYNLPPWLCLKQPYWVMSMLIPGPKSPGNNIDVYLQPLIDELKELWIDGAVTWDAKKKENFRLRAALLWTINDYPAYGMLSAWSTKGRLACPYCNKDTDYFWLKFGGKNCYMGHRRFLPLNHKWRKNKNCFNNKVETRVSPTPLTGDQVLQQYESFEQVTFGKMTGKRKRQDEIKWHNWRKKSIFFELPYWKILLVRHNLDVMHIEKNICDSILGTLLDIVGKSKDSVKARLDMQLMGIRKDQHPLVKNNQYILPPACYTLSKDEKTYLCKFLEGVKMPDGHASNIKRCVDVKGCKVSGLKTHDCHVIFQKLLTIVVRDILPEKVVVPLIRLSRFFNAICSKELDVQELDKLSISIGETLSELEMIFPPAFFDIMMHLPVHLAEEAKLGGPVCYRWMYPVERYLRTLKGYVRNKAHPEGSIAEGYISEESMTFCSRFLEDVDSKLNRPERHENAVVNEPPSGLSIFGKIDYSKKGFSFESLSKYEMKRIRHYIITNCDEATPWVNEHLDELKRSNPRNVHQRHKDQFVHWFERKVSTLHKEGKVDDLMYALSKGPDQRARVHSRCFINGYLFRTAGIENNLTTQNSGVVVKGDETTGNIDWYGVIRKIISVEFPMEKEVWLFKCDWYDVPAANRNQGRGYKKDQYGIIDIDTTRFRYIDDAYILGNQAEQVFYVKSVKKPNWSTVVRMKPRNLFAMPVAQHNEHEGEIDVDSLDVGVEDMNVAHTPEEITNWSRGDIQGASGDTSEIKNAQLQCRNEQSDSETEDDEDDDTYIDDGHVALANSLGQESDDEFFV